MKNLKKYILAIVVCFCMLFSTLTGCALIVPDNTKALEEKAINIGTTVLTKQEVVDLWYSFYTENSSVFYYYSEDQILDIFYKNIVVKYAVMQEVDKLIADNVLMYSAGDDAQVWLDVLESVSESVDAYEKALFTQQGFEEKNLPTRLQSETTASSSSSEKSYLYKEYEFKGMDDYECDYLYSDKKQTISNVGKNVLNSQVKDIVNYLNTFIYKTRDEEELELDNLADLKNKVNDSDYFTTIADDSQNRAKAFDMYVGNLMLSAKADGKTNDKATVLFDQIKRLYISAYETYIQNMYSNYINSLVDKATIGGEENKYYTLNNQAIVTRYLQLLGKDIQNYKIEDNYIAVLEAKADNALLLYHYKGDYYYFTVQHLLVEFDEDIKSDLSNLPGNQSTSSASKYEVYEYLRNNFFNQVSDGNDGYLSSWEDYKNATYRDENGYDVYTITVDNEEYLVYFDSESAPESDEEVSEENVLTGHYYIDANNENADENGRVYLKQSEFDTCKKATVTVGQVIEEFNNTYSETIAALQSNSTVEDVISALETANVQYMISEDLIEAYLNANPSELETFNHKVYANIFMQHAFKYSADSASLGTDLSDYVGMIISARPDNHNVGGTTYVSEFTNKARELAEAFIEKTYSTSQISAENYAISDYGIHIMVINDVYQVDKSAPITGAPITGDDVTAEKIFGTNDADEIAEKVAEAVEKMQSIYVAPTSSQTLYEYVYEIVRDELIGSNGTIYTIERNTLYLNYTDGNMDNGEAAFPGKMTYQELMDAIS